MLNRLMKGSRALTYVLALALVFSLTACDDNGGGMDDDDDDNGDEPTLLSDILGERDDLSTLFQAVDASGQLNLTANPDADITVFAPNNDAFADINLEVALSGDNSELLEEVVQYHVLSQSVLSSGLSEGAVETALGDEIQITTDADGNFLVNGNSITTADLEADNGVLHVIDGLLLENRALAERLALTTPTTQLAQLAQSVGAAESLGTLENATLFAPRNIQDAVAESGLDLNDDQLTNALLYHVVNAEALVQAGVLDEAGPIDSETLIGLLEGAEGNTVDVPTLLSDGNGGFETITIALNEDGSITINGDQATLDQAVLDKYTDNFSNVFHVIDGVLLPPSLQPDEGPSFELFAETSDLDPGDGNPGIQCVVARDSGGITFFNGNNGGVFTWTGSELVEERSATALNDDITQEANPIDRCSGVTVDSNGNVYFLFRSNETSEQSSWPTAVYKLDSSGSTSVLAFEDGLSGITPVNGTLYLNGNEFRGASADGFFSISDSGEEQSLTEVATNGDLDLANGLLTSDADGNLYAYSGGFGSGDFADALVRVQNPAGDANLDVFLDPYAGDSPLSFDQGNNIRDLRFASTEGGDFLVLFNNSFEAENGDEWAAVNLSDQSVSLLFTTTDLTTELSVGGYVSGFSQATAVSSSGEIFPASRELGEATHYAATVSNILP